MGRIEGGDIDYRDLKCSFCGKADATAYWSSPTDGNRGVVACCPGCAISALPKLIADAIWRETNANDFRRRWADAEKEYWYAVSCASLNALLRKQKETGRFEQGTGAGPGGGA
jgi:hypothetical protein